MFSVRFYRGVRISVRRRKDFCFSRQRKYRSGKMYWMTFWWPWPKVITVTQMNKNLHVCRIKWEPLNQSLQNMVAISGHAYDLIRCWRNSVGNLIFAKFSLKISDVFFQSQTLYWTYLRNGWSDWCEPKRRCIGWILGELCDIDLLTSLMTLLFQGLISK